jgi:hypothetical protein
MTKKLYNSQLNGQNIMDLREDITNLLDDSGADEVEILQALEFVLGESIYEFHRKYETTVEELLEGTLNTLEKTITICEESEGE